MGEAQREWGRAYRSCGQPLVNEQHRPLLLGKSTKLSPITTGINKVFYGADAGSRTIDRLHA